MVVSHIIALNRPPLKLSLPSHTQGPFLKSKHFFTNFDRNLINFFQKPINFKICFKIMTVEHYLSFLNRYNQNYPPKIKKIVNLLQWLSRPKFFSFLSYLHPDLHYRLCCSKWRISTSLVISINPHLFRTIEKIKIGNCICSIHAGLGAWMALNGETSLRFQVDFP